MSSNETTMINFVVGGLNFCLSVADIKRYPDSYFAHLLKDEWNADKSHAVVLDRDGQAFRTVHYFIITGYFKSHYCRIEDISSLLAVKREADFFNILELIKLCDEKVVRHMVYYLISHASTESYSKFGGPYDCVTECADAIKDPLVQALYPIRRNRIATTHFMAMNDRTFSAKLGADQYRYGNYHHHHWSDYILPYESLNQMKSQLTRWPMNNEYSVDNIDPRLIVLENSCRSIVRCVCESDCFLYIYTSAIGGGAVSATVNGQTVTITETGDCMALSAGLAYSVSTVTSGVLVLVRILLDPNNNDQDGCSGDHGSKLLEWTIHDAPVVSSVFEGCMHTEDPAGDAVVRAEMEAAVGKEANKNSEDAGGGDVDNGRGDSDDGSGDRGGSGGSGGSGDGSDGGGSGDGSGGGSSSSDDNTLLSTLVGESIVQAVRASLEGGYSSVVLCLNKYYPVQYSDDVNRRFETDPDLLRGLHADLYALLSAHFNVDLVCTYVGWPIHFENVSRCAVLDFVEPAGGRIKVAAPLYCGQRDVLTSLMVSGVIQD